MTKTIRVGFIGLGGICRSRHVPGLRAIEGVEIVAVANRSRESSERAAREFGIPEICDSWEQLVARDDLDAVFVGTWPYMHRAMSVAALQAGRHVFCQARMALDAADAKAMYEQGACDGSRGDVVSGTDRPACGRGFDAVVAGRRGGPRAFGACAEFSECLRLGGGSHELAQGSPVERSERADTGHVHRGDSSLARVDEVGFRRGRRRSCRSGSTGRASACASRFLTSFCSRRSCFRACRCSMRSADAYVGGRTRSRSTATSARCGMTARWMCYSSGKRARGSWKLPLAAAEIYDVAHWRVERDFVDAIREGREYHPNFEDGYRYMQVIQAVYDSAERGVVVNLE